MELPLCDFRRSIPQPILEPNRSVWAMNRVFPILHLGHAAPMIFTGGLQRRSRNPSSRWEQPPSIRYGLLSSLLQRSRRCWVDGDRWFIEVTFSLVSTIFIFFSFYYFFLLKSSCSSLFFFGMSLAGFSLPNMGFIGPTHLNNDDNIYVGDKHQAELGINNYSLIFFWRTKLLSRRMLYVSIEIIDNLLLYVATIIGSHDAVAISGFSDEKYKEVKHIYRLKTRRWHLVYLESSM